MRCKLEASLQPQGTFTVSCINPVGLFVDILDDNQSTLDPESHPYSEDSFEGDIVIAEEDDDVEDDDEDDEDLDDDEDEDDDEKDDHEWEEVDEDEEDDDEEDDDGTPEEETPRRRGRRRRRRRRRGPVSREDRGPRLLCQHRRYPRFTSVSSASG